MSHATFLLLNLVLAFYNVGTIWAHEVDVFRSWKLLDPRSFPRVQETHWRKVPYWVFLPVGLALAGAIALIWYHPDNSPAWGIWCVPGCLILSCALTGLLWGRWQAKLSKDPLGSESPYLDKILTTHWIRTLLINAYGFILLAWTIECLARQ